MWLHMLAGSEGYYIQVSGIVTQAAGTAQPVGLCWTVNYTRLDVSEFVTLEECGLQGLQQLWTVDSCFDSP